MRHRSGLSSAPIEFLPRRFYLVVIRERTSCSIHCAKTETSSSIPTSHRYLFPRTPGKNFVSLQEQLLPSTPDNSEFVLGIQQTIRFNSFLTSILSAATSQPLAEDPALRQPAAVGSENVHYFFLRRRHLREELQVIHLICRWRLLYLHLPPHEALAPFEHLPYLFSSFLSSCDTFDPPNLLVSLVGIAKGLEMKLLDAPTAVDSSASSTWNAIREHSDDNPTNFWTISRRFILYSGTDRITVAGKDDPSELEDTISLMKRRRVSLVVTLSKMHSDSSTFAAHGLEVVDISSTAATSSKIPLGDKLFQSDKVLLSRFLEACEGTEGLIAVDASSGSGCVSAATCIGCYLMKHLNFTSQEAIGWLQFCFPVKIPMTWILFLGQLQSQMWLEGERFRRAREGDLPDDLTGSAVSCSTHINIGKISLGRLSLLGTRDREKHRIDSHTTSFPVSTCLSSRSQESQYSPTSATTTAQLKRRPLTQGSVGSRRYHRSTDGTSLRADFALMHKFLHQTPTSNTRSSTSSTTNSTTSSLHTVPSRPKASTRSPDGTPANCTKALA